MGAIKHATASAFVFHKFRPSGTWGIALIWHPRMECYMPPGGHVDANETAATTAMRELAEETGLVDVQLVQPVMPSLPPGYPYGQVSQPWWVTEEPVGADGRTRQPHAHIDHHYVMIAASAEPKYRGEHNMRWFSLPDVLRLDVPGDFRVLMLSLFAVFSEGGGVAWKTGAQLTG